MRSSSEIFSWGSQPFFGPPSGRSRVTAGAQPAKRPEGLHVVVGSECHGRAGDVAASRPVPLVATGTQESQFVQDEGGLLGPLAFFSCDYFVSLLRHRWTKAFPQAA